MPKFHLRHIRLPNQVMDIYDTLIYKSEKIIFFKSKVTSTHSITFDDEMVLARGFQIVCFELMEKWFTVGKIRNLQGRHTDTTVTSLLLLGYWKMVELNLQICF